MGIKDLFRRLGTFKKRKTWYNFECPFHHGSKLNFGVNLESRWYKCFGCGVSGPLGSLPEKLSMKMGATSILDDLPELKENTSPVEGSTYSGFDPDAWMGVHYTPLRYVEDSVMARRAEEYLGDRGVPMDYPVGFLDTEPTRIVFPFYSGNKIIYWFGREMLNSSVKTKNPDTKDGWLPKNKVLWNINSLYNQDLIVICEGVFDAIGVEVKAKLPATCLLGKTISQQQILLLKRNKVGKIVVFLDADAVQDCLQLAITLYKPGFETYYVNEWSEEEIRLKSDPSELPEEDVVRKIKNAVPVTHTTEIRFRSEF